MIGYPVSNVASDADRSFIHGYFGRALSLGLMNDGTHSSPSFLAAETYVFNRVSKASKVPDPALRMNHDLVKLGQLNVKDIEDALELPVRI